MISVAAVAARPVRRAFIQTSGHRLFHGTAQVWQSANEAGPSQPKSALPTTNSGNAKTGIETGTKSNMQEGPQPGTETEEQQPSFTTPASARYAEEDRKPLPYLQQPLGVREKPSSRKLTFAERRDRAFDHDRVLAKRKVIVKEATRGYFSDFHAMRSHGGKTWRAPKTLIRQDRSLFFPAIEGTALSDGAKRNTADMLRGKVSIVCVLTSILSEQHAKSFYAAALDVYQKDHNFQLVQINLQENRLKAYLVSLFTSSLRTKIEEQLQRTYLLSHQDLSLEREGLGLHNKHVGYTYLVGPDEKIRWAGGAFAEKEERQALVACTGVLLSRLSEEQKGRK